MGTRADNLDGSCREVPTGRHSGWWHIQFTFAEHTCVKRRVSVELWKFGEEIQRGMKDLAAML